jgi:hypothetical protein
MEPWFEPNQWAWLPGTLLGVLGGTWGSLCGVLVPRGKGKAFMWASFWTFMMVGVALSSAGIVALVNEQQYGVWFSLLMAGVLTLLVIGPLGLVMRQAYRQHEQRRMQAQDFG